MPTKLHIFMKGLYYRHSKYIMNSCQTFYHTEVQPHIIFMNYYHQFSLFCVKSLTYRLSLLHIGNSCFSILYYRNLSLTLCWTSSRNKNLWLIIAPADMSLMKLGQGDKLKEHPFDLGWLWNLMLHYIT